MSSIGNKNENECFGCGACSKVCPKQAIKMIENERGFLIPRIDEEKCVECGMCKKVCPFDSETIRNKIKLCFAAISKDISVLKNSTSGGISFELCKYIISNGGVVYGCTYENNNIHHIRVERIDELYKIQKSKYVQSNMDNIFMELKKDLLQNKEVLFTGTGCQIAGIKNFLMKDYDNLYFVEVICHGVPSPGLFKKYINWLSEKCGEIATINFRTKKKHKCGEHFMLEVINKNNEIKYFYSNKDPFYSSFLEGKTLRKTCYNCQFKGTNRVSDITIGDFWGIEKIDNSFPSKYGTSLVIVNSVKGSNLINNIKENLEIKEIPSEKVLKNNNSLMTPTDKSKSINYNINEDNLVKQLTPRFKMKNEIKNHVPEWMKKILKKIIKVR